jgi:hypothetical protein
MGVVPLVPVLSTAVPLELKDRSTTLETSATRRTIILPHMMILRRLIVRYIPLSGQ